MSIKKKEVAAEEKTVAAREESVPAEKNINDDGDGEANSAEV